MITVPIAPAMPPPANAALISALSAIYPDLTQPQVSKLAAKVDRLASLARKETPWLCTALRDARIAADLTQAEVAAALDWSPSKVIRIESGAVGVSFTDLHALIGLYRIKDQAAVERMVSESRARRQRRGPKMAEGGGDA